MKRGALQGASLGMTERGPKKVPAAPASAGVSRLKWRRRQLSGEERYEKGPAGCARPAHMTYETYMTYFDEKREKERPWALKR